MKIIALEESFWYEKLATEGSTVAHVRQLRLRREPGGGTLGDQVGTIRFPCVKGFAQWTMS